MVLTCIKNTEKISPLSLPCELSSPLTILLCKILSLKVKRNGPDQHQNLISRCCPIPQKFHQNLSIFLVILQTKAKTFLLELKMIYIIMKCETCTHTVLSSVNFNLKNATYNTYECGLCITWIIESQDIIFEVSASSSHHHFAAKVFTKLDTDLTCLQCKLACRNDYQCYKHHQSTSS